MRRVTLLLTGSLLAAGLGFPLSAPAQTPNAAPTPAPTGRVRAWRATLPGGSFSVAVHAMVSVAMHEYVVDGAARVTEVNIDTTGNSQARFYFLEPITPQTPLAAGQSIINKVQDLATEAAGRTGQDETWKKVVKTYPGSTHAHTVEFRIGSKDDLKKIFDSADQAMRESKEIIFNLQ